VDAAAIFANPSFDNGTEPDTVARNQSDQEAYVGLQTTVSWTTNEPSTTVVVLTPEGGGSEKRGGIQSFVKSHSVGVSGNGQINIQSTDLAGNTTTRNGGTIAKKAPAGAPAETE